MADKYIKPEINVDEVSRLLEEIFKYPIKQIEEAAKGKIKKVYFFECRNKAYVIRFSMDDKEFKLEKYLQETAEDKNFPIGKLLYAGIFNNLYYAVSEKIEGVAISSLNEKELKGAMSSVMETLTKLHSIEVMNVEGYGWLDSKGKGSYNSFTEFLQGFFSKEQEGFWKGWYDLFESSFLDYERFDFLYKKMMVLAPYCEGKRYLTHMDFHYDNIIINNSKVAGIIDWAGLSYVDFIFDVARLVMEFPNHNLLNDFYAFYKQYNMDTSNFKERFLCAALCHSLDGMRFWVKQGSQEAYKAILENILIILDKYDYAK